MRQNRVTQAAEGLPRWRWTTAELVRLTELGAFVDGDKFELIGGEIVPMSPMGRKHEILGEEIEDRLRTQCPAHLKVVAERQFNLSAETYTTPDILLRPEGIRTPDLRGDTALLVIEIAASSRAYDLGLKAHLYAQHGVREYWVVDAVTLVTTVHRELAADGYRHKFDAAAGDILTPALAPALSLRLSELRLD